MVNYQYIINSPLFENMDINSLSEVIKTFNVKEYGKNETIFHEKDLVSKMYLIVNGRVEVTKYDIDGNKNIVAILTNLDLFAESILLSKNPISPYTTTTLEKCSILSIDIDSFYKICTKYPTILTNMMHIIANKNTYLTFKIDCISKNTIRERVFEVLRYYYIKQNCASFKLPYTKVQLAEFLCVNRSSLSRIMSDMVKDNIFQYRNKTYYLNEDYFKSA